MIVWNFSLIRACFSLTVASYNEVVMDYEPIMFNVRLADEMWPAKAFSLARKAHVYSASLFDKKYLGPYQFWNLDIKKFHFACHEIWAVYPWFGLKMIIFKSLLTTCKASITFWGSNWIIESSQTTFTNFNQVLLALHGETHSSLQFLVNS